MTSLLLAVMLTMFVILSGEGLTRAQEVQPSPVPPLAPSQTQTTLPSSSTQVTTPANDSPEAAPPATDVPVQRDVPLGKLVAAPKIDGVMSADEWKGAAQVELRYQVEPGDNVMPTEKTEVMLAADREHLYVAFRAYDSSPSSVRAPVSRRDNIYNDDYVALYLDTYDDRRRAYVIYFNPLGIQADGIITGGTLEGVSQIDDLTWDGIYASKGSLTEDGYIVEAAIPFKSLRFQAGKEKRWGLHLQRWIARKQERVHWQQISRDRAELLAQMGTVSGLGDVYAGRTLDLIPTITGSINGEREAGQLSPAGLPGQARLNSVNRIEPGLTATYTITPNLTLSGTINPDFSQIEADAPQIDVNQRFPLFFPERRPFFLEGIETFRSPGLLTFVNTRQIVDPDYGIKLTGKIGKNTIGFLSASDRAPGLRLQPTAVDFGKNAQFNILRYQRDIFGNSRVGAFLLDRRFADARNTVAALDAQVRFREVNTIGFQLGRSSTRGTDGVTRPGSATYAWYEHRGRNLRIFVNDTRITRQYRAQTGFVRRTGFIANSANLGYEWQPKEKSWWVSVRPFVVPRLLRTDEGFTDESYIDPGVDIKLARGISFYIYHSFHKDSFAGRTFPYNFDVIYYTVNSFKRIDFDGFIQRGEGVSFDPSNPQLGHRIWQSHTVSFRPNNRLATQLLYLSDRIAAKGTGARLLRQDILRNSTRYQFTRNNAVRTIIDYDTARRQTGVSLLYAYTPRPNTALFIGYNDLLFNGIDPLDNTRAQGIFRQRRTLFMKASYNFRF